jgi:GH15 family glucan-1,4-alpha-glucosidase
MTAELGTRGTAWTPETRLYSDGVVVGAGGTPLVVPPGSAFRRIADTPYLDPASGESPGAYRPSPADVDAARARLAGAQLPTAHGCYAEMARTAVVDIDALTFPTGAVVAAASPYWRYVWPRDAGFVAAALTLVGHAEDARRVLQYVGDMQERDGTWQARYLPDASGQVPDDRGLQLDGLGWTLWASWLWVRIGAGDPKHLADTTAAATRAALGCLDTVTGLPGAAQDYWEMDLDEVTLGTAAPVLLALRCGGDLAAELDQHELADRAGEAAGRLESAIHGIFGPHGYQRRAGGTGGRDASIAFLLPPFAPGDSVVRAAWRDAVEATKLPNGGVRPGEEWPDLATAWTPQVSLHALTAAVTGDTALAHRLLSWLDVRRTRLGSLPEKVTAEGRPAAVAPLGLTGATVLLALLNLDGRPLPVPGQ